MTDRPIIFAGPMVLALLDRRKTQTRRLASSPLAKCQPGDRLWVRERTMVQVVEAMPEIGIRYDADGTDRIVAFPADRMKQIPVPGKRLSMGCYREASRLTLVVTDVRLQRLHQISPDDAYDEGAPERSGFPDFHQHGQQTYVHWYRNLWDELHGLGAWGQNPEVVALTFTVHFSNIDQMEAVNG